jgi:DNA polymerase-3 subunit delta
MAEIVYKDISKSISGLTPASAPPVFLLFGDEFLVKKAFDAILDRLLPPDQRSFGYEPIDSTGDRILAALEKINTFSLVSGTKVVALLDSSVFHSKHDTLAFLEKIKGLVARDAMKKAAGQLAALLSVLGLGFEDVSGEKRNERLKYDSDQLGDDAWLDAVIGYGIDTGTAVPAAVDDGKILQEAIEKGFPQGHHLVITTDVVDKRRSLFKAIAIVGMIVDCSVPKGDRRADRLVQEEVLKGGAREILAGTGKQIEPAAYAALLERTGFALRTFSAGLEKLVSYIGDKDLITAQDVAQALERTKQDPIYELTNAFSEKNLEQTLFFLNSVLSSATVFPLQVLAALTNQVRRLLMIRAFMESSQGRVWKTAMPYHLFQSQVMPAIQAHDQQLLSEIEAWDAQMSGSESDEGQETGKRGKARKSKPETDLVIAKNPRSPYPVYMLCQRAERFTSDELVDALSILSETDRRLKSSGQVPRLVLEQAVFRIFLPRSG